MLLSLYKQTFIAIRQCSCAKDGTNLMTMYLNHAFYREQADNVISSVNSERRKCFKYSRLLEELGINQRGCN